MYNIKVAFLLGSLNRGGLETLVLDVFRKASCADFDFIGIYRKTGSYLPDFEATGVPFFQCSPSKGRYISYLFRLRKLLKNGKIQIVHAQQTIDFLFAKIACLGTDIRVVETFHGYDFEGSRVLKCMNKLSIRLADAVCFVSEAQCKYYIKSYRLSKKLQGKCHVVYNGVNFSKLDQKYDIPDFLKKIDFAQPRKIKLAMVGNFVNGRSQSVVCKALAVLRERGLGDFDFYFIGKRNDKEPWRYDDCVSFVEGNGLSECVHFMGGRGDVPAILQNIDGFVYSTDHDTFGIAVVEAMAAGLPVVVNDWDVMREITQNGKWAILYKSNDVEDCADKIANLIENISSYKEKAHFDSQKVRGEFSIENHIAQLKNIYMNCLTL